MLWRNKVVFVNPNDLFPKYPPHSQLYKQNEYNDLTEVGMQSYLQILPSLALYGFKYAVEINKSHEVINGDFRVFGAIELGKEVPAVYVRLPQGRTLITSIILRRLRKLVNKQSLFFRRFNNPEFRHGKVSLLCHFQLPLFDSVYPIGEVYTQKRKHTPFLRKLGNIIRYYLNRKMI